MRIADAMKVLVSPPCLGVGSLHLVSWLIVSKQFNAPLWLVWTILGLAFLYSLFGTLLICLQIRQWSHRRVFRESILKLTNTKGKERDSVVLEKLLHTSVYEDRLFMLSSFAMLTPALWLYRLFELTNR